MEFRHAPAAVASFIVAAVLLAPATTVSAQESLPKALKGEWTSPYVAEWSVRITKQNPDGSIEGTASYYGKLCGARDAPMTGTFDGTTPVTRTDLDPKPACGKAVFRLKKGGSKHWFEGKSQSSGYDGFLDPS